MTLEDLQHLLATAPWFRHLGQPPLATIRDPFDDAGDWDWLPTTHEQPDPIHNETLKTLATDSGCDGERAAAEFAAAHTTLRALRPVPDTIPELTRGPHNLTPAARGAAVYAARMAAREIVVGQPSFWCNAIRLFHAGHWPCGLHPSRRIAIF